jgi:hypothetical protein
LSYNPGKMGLSYVPGKVGWWEGFEWGEELGGGSEWVSGWLGIGKVGLSYNPGKVGLGVGRHLS